MSRKEFSLKIGETWTIEGVVNDKNGTPVDMTGGSIEFRMSTADALVMKLVSPADITILAGSGGEYLIELDASDLRQNDLDPGSYFYEVVAVTKDGGVSIQNEGKISLLKSLRKKFP